jgi:hypothetical protein
LASQGDDGDLNDDGDDGGGLMGALSKAGKKKGKKAEPAKEDGDDKKAAEDAGEPDDGAPRVLSKKEKEKLKKEKEKVGQHVFSFAKHQLILCFHAGQEEGCSYREKG